MTVPCPTFSAHTHTMTQITAAPPPYDSSASAAYIASRPAPAGAAPEDVAVHRLQLSATDTPLVAATLRFPRPEHVWMSRYSVGCTAEGGCVPKHTSFPTGCGFDSASGRLGSSAHAWKPYHIVDTDPEGEETVRSVPLGSCRFPCQYFVELPHLLDDRPAPHTRRQSSIRRMWMARTITYSTVGKYGATSAESMVAPPEARLNTISVERLSLALHRVMRHADRQIAQTKPTK